MKGRKPRPAEQKAREGKATTDEAVAVGGRGKPDRPTGLTPDARKAWDAIVEDLDESGILARADWPVVESFAVAVGRAREARKTLNKIRREWGGIYYATANGNLARHPAVTEEAEAWREVRQLADQLGLGPVGRARLGLGSKPKGKGAQAAPAAPSIPDAPGKLTAIPGGRS